VYDVPRFGALMTCLEELLNVFPFHRMLPFA
jgi:hypothetical protein